MSEPQLFAEWASGLPCILDTCYYCNRSAVDDLGAILEETDAEKARYAESDAENLLTLLIYRELMKGCKKMSHQKIVIFDNYHDEMRDYEEIRDLLLYTHDADEITDDMVYEEMAFQDDLSWQDIHEELRGFFNGENWLAMGAIGRWDGRRAAGCVFDDFDDLFYKATQDCDYWRIWDEDGHFYLKCSHHDGTNIFEIKRITQRARNYIDDWTSDKTDAEKHSVVFHCNFFSALPRFAQKVWNCGDTSEIGG